MADIEREFALMARLGCRLVALGEPAYPAALAATPDASPLLIVRGRIEALSRPMVSIVGSRNASGLGVKFAERIAADLAEAGVVVPSGLARGIDAAAHRASLRQGTLAVLAGGQGRIYPPQHADMVEQLIEAGAAVSESPFEMEPRARYFPRRNRIVAGLSLATVVVEAARKSGSLITAQMARDYGREVFAVPGSPLDPRAEGTNDLLRGLNNGTRVHLCRGAEDVLAEIGPQIAGGYRPQQGKLFDSGGDGVGPDDGPGEGDALFDELDWLIGRQEKQGLREPGLFPDGLAPFAEAMTAERAPALGAGERDAPGQVLELLGASALDVDDLVRQAALPARVVKAAQLELEMEGRARRNASGGHVLAEPRGVRP